MPHIIPMSSPAKLSLERGISSSLHFGYDVLIYDGDPERSQAIVRFRQALGRLATSSDEDIQVMRQNIDKRYRQETAGAPADFEFACSKDESIIERLQQADPTELYRFCLWNRDQMWGQKIAMAEAMPALQAETVRRSALLVEAGLLPPESKDLFEQRIEMISWRKAYYPVDSFEGGLIDGMANSKGIHISHRFTDGYHFGDPTNRYYQIGFHEIGHAVRSHCGDGRALRIAPMVEEVLLSHYMEISDMDSTQPRYDIFEATAEGSSYESVRRLFGLVLAEQKDDVMLQTAGEALTGPSGSLSEVVFLAHLHHNFTKLFPEHGSDAMQLFLHEYANAHPLKAHRVAKRWADAGLARQRPAA